MGKKYFFGMPIEDANSTQAIKFKKSNAGSGSGVAATRGRSHEDSGTTERKRKRIRASNRLCFTKLPFDSSLNCLIVCTRRQKKGGEISQPGMVSVLTLVSLLIGSGPAETNTLCAHAHGLSPASCLNTLIRRACNLSSVSITLNHALHGPTLFLWRCSGLA